ncbi:hypothetical protein J3F84DRAFT_223792 [Trichoderma pleuroticola]
MFGLLFLSAAAIFPQLALGQFQVVQYESGDAGLDLGGAANGQYWGVMWKQGEGDWNYVPMGNYPSACSAECGHNDVSYPLGDTGFSARICDNPWSCVPGNQFNCQINFSGNGIDNGWISFTGTTDSSSWGLGYTLTSYCGGLVAL